MVLWFCEIKEERKSKAPANMLPEKQLSGILGLLLCASFPTGIIVVLSGLVKVAEMVGGGEMGLPGIRCSLSGQLNIEHNYINVLFLNCEKANIKKSASPLLLLSPVAMSDHG